MQEGIGNMKKMKVFGFVLGALALAVGVQPAQAACGAPFLITSINNATEQFAYVVNPTVTPGAGGNGVSGSSVTDAITGYFWGVGVGNPASGVGADSGTFPALEWLYIYPNYPASVLTTWAASTAIDTCIDVQGPLGQRCQVTFFQDVDTQTGAGLFALVSTADDPASGDFLLDNGGVNITMAPQAGMQILASSRTGGGTGVMMTLAGPSESQLAAGSYLSTAPQCQGAGSGGAANGLVVGYRAVTQVLPRGSAPPSDFAAGAWNPAGGNTGIGAPTVINVPCNGDQDVYVSYQLLFDSGFTAPLVSNTTTRVECGPNVADPSQHRVKPEGRQAPRTRTR
jgi:hypothetical protein